jgi:hypothetical protein
MIADLCRPRASIGANMLGIAAAPRLHSYSPVIILKDWIRAADANAETDGSPAELWAVVSELILAARQ